MHYWIDPGLEKTICADGTVFFHVPIDEKLVMKNPIPCKKDTHASIRRWYQTFQETLMQHGVYVHPLWLFRKNHGGEWGFTVGDRPDDDLPMPLRMTCQQSSILIYQLLSQSTMFPNGSPLHDVVANCYGNGLKALKAILLRSHPAFADERSTLVTTYPKQKDKSLLDYKMEAEDFLQMREGRANVALHCFKLLFKAFGAGGRVLFLGLLEFEQAVPVCRNSDRGVLGTSILVDAGFDGC